ncbi:MAG: adenine phosphoribosyltransferase [Clostridiales bacterium]|jgi:adenine phosphoribosyltransferase|nr:adenine phosphoribosyltransferase [Clostridiales bacterium]
MENEKLINRLLEVIPKNSIGRYDLLPVFKDTELFGEITKKLSVPYIGKIDFVAAPEAVGWILGSAIARELNAGFIPMRKIDKLPYPKDELISQNYVDYSGKEKILEIKKDYVTAGDRVLIVDEWVETGVSMRCCVNLLEKLGCIIVGLATIGLNYCKGTKDWIDMGMIQYIGKNI